MIQNLVKKNTIGENICIKKYIDNFWHVADLLIYENGCLLETIRINKFFNITDNWIHIYGETGGQGIGWKQGELIRKIFIGNSEFKEI